MNRKNKIEKLFIAFCWYREVLFVLRRVDFIPIAYGNEWVYMYKMDQFAVLQFGIEIKS